jgi:hypothetical protein
MKDLQKNTVKLLGAWKSAQVTRASWSAGIIKIFPITPKAYSNSSQIFSYNLIYFSMKKSFNIQELLHCKSKCHETKLMHPSSSSRAFQRDQERNMKHRGSMDLIGTK